MAHRTDRSENALSILELEQLKRDGFWAGYRGISATQCPFQNKLSYKSQVWIHSYIVGKQARNVEVFDEVLRMAYSIIRNKID